MMRYDFLFYASWPLLEEAHGPSYPTLTHSYPSEEVATVAINEFQEPDENLTNSLGS